MPLFETMEPITLVDRSAYLAMLKNPKRAYRAVRSNGRINQPDLYCFLKGRFGPPNGIQSMLRADDSENFINWQYSLSTNGVFLDINGSVRFLEFHFFSNSAAGLSQLDETVFVKSLKALLENHKDLIREEKNKLEKWDMFLNTHKRLLNTIDSLEKEYRSIRLKEPVVYSSPTVTRDQVKTYNYQIRKYVEAANRKRTLGLSLRLLYPILSESLINLILFILARDEIRSDKRVLEATLRSPIDIRVKTMHLNCIGLKGQYNQGDERFKAFLRIMDGRNDFLHGNVLPANHTYDMVYFDRKVPLFDEEKDISVEFTRQNLFQVSESEVEADAKAVKDFRQYLIENIEERLTKEVGAVMNKSDLGWNRQTGRVGILFGEARVQSFMIAKDRRKHA